MLKWKFGDTTITQLIELKDDSGSVPVLPDATPVPPNGVLLHVGVHKTGTTAIQAARPAGAPPLLIAADHEGGQLVEGAIGHHEGADLEGPGVVGDGRKAGGDRKSTRLNSSH